MLKMLALSMESMTAEGPDGHQGELSLKAVAADAHDARPSGGICNWPLMPVMCTSWQ